MSTLREDSSAAKLLSLRNKNIAYIREQIDSSDHDMDQLLVKNETALQKSIKDLKSHHATLAACIKGESQRKKARLEGLLTLERYQLGVLEHIQSDEMLHLYITLEKDARGIETSALSDTGTTPYTPSPHCSKCSQNLNTTTPEQNRDQSSLSLQSSPLKQHHQCHQKILTGGDREEVEDRRREKATTDSLAQAQAVARRFEARGRVLPRLVFNHGSDAVLIQEHKDAIQLSKWRYAVQDSNLYQISPDMYLDSHMSKWLTPQLAGEKRIENTPPATSASDSSKPDSNSQQLHSHMSSDDKVLASIHLQERDVTATPSVKLSRRGRSISPAMVSTPIENSFMLGNTVVTLGEHMDTTIASTTATGESVTDDYPRYASTLKHNNTNGARARHKSSPNARAVHLSRTQGGYTPTDLENSWDIRALDAAIERARAYPSVTQCSPVSSNGLSSSAPPSSSFNSSSTFKTKSTSQNNLKLDLRELLKQFDNEQVPPKLCDVTIEPEAPHTPTGSSTWIEELGNSGSRARSVDSHRPRKPRWGSALDTRKLSQTRSASLSPDKRTHQSSNQSQYITMFKSDEHSTPVAPYISFDNVWKRLLFEYEVLPNKPNPYSRSVLARLVGFQLRDNDNCYQRFLEIWNTDVFKLSVLNVFCLQFRVTKKNAAVRARGMFQNILVHTFPTTVNRVKIFRFKPTTGPEEQHLDFTGA